MRAPCRQGGRSDAVHSRFQTCCWLLADLRMRAAKTLDALKCAVPLGKPGGNVPMCQLVHEVPTACSMHDALVLPGSSSLSRTHVLHSRTGHAPMGPQRVCAETLPLRRQTVLPWHWSTPHLPPRRGVKHVTLLWRTECGAAGSGRQRRNASTMCACVCARARARMGWATLCSYWPGTAGARSAIPVHAVAKPWRHGPDSTCACM